MSPAGPAAATAEAAGRTARSALRRLAGGVSVLTTGEGARAHGTTVSALCALSREPLLLGACLGHRSRFLELLGAGGLFTVNVLSGQQALLADWFADPARPRGAAQFRGLGWSPDPVTGAPALPHTLARMSCRLTGTVPAGDHLLLVAEVLDGATAAGPPLLSLDGRLHAADPREVRRRRTRPGSPDTSVIPFE